MPKIELVGGGGLLLFFAGAAAMKGTFGPIPTAEVMNLLYAVSILGLIVAACVGGYLQGQQKTC